MGRFVFEETRIEGVRIITPEVISDARGAFMETYDAREFSARGIPNVFVQDNQSQSVRGVLRGLHFQEGEHAQAKLVRVVRGEVFDVAVDLRPESATYGRWVGATLSVQNRRQLFVPGRCAHGFLALSAVAEVVYKCDAFYCPAAERGLMWDDPWIGIDWPLAPGASPLLSDRDRCHPPFEGAGTVGGV